MSCQLQNIILDPVASGETWGGFSFAITYSDDTAYASTLARVRMTFKDSSGNADLKLDSNSAQITINTATAYAWDFTVESRTLSLDAGYYSWAIETTDGDGVVNKDALAGTIQITTDPHS